MTPQSPTQNDSVSQRQLEDLVFVAFNMRVFAIDRYDGTTVWRTQLPKGAGYVAILLDGDRLVACANGYTYGLDPWRGAILWTQEFSGEGVGIASLASTRGASDSAAAAQAAAAAARAAATTAAVT